MGKRKAQDYTERSNPFDERMQRVTQLLPDADKASLFEAMLFQDAGTLDPNRFSVAVIKKQLEAGLDWIEQKFLCSDKTLRTTAIASLVELSAITISKLNKLTEIDGEATVRRARQMPFWPVFVANDAVSFRKIKKLLSDLQLGKISADVVNSRKVETRRSVAKDASRALAEIIQTSRKLGHHRNAYKDRSANQRLPLSTQKYLHLDEESLQTNIRETELALGNMLERFSTFIGVPNPFGDLGRFRKHVRNCEPLPDLNVGTSTQWAAVAKTIVLAFTDAPEALPLLRPLGEHRDKHYVNRQGKTPEGSRERNIQVRIFERINDAFEVIAKKS